MSKSREYIANAYADAGFKIVPVEVVKDGDKYRKRPRADHGFNSATNDMEIIRSWWQEYPDHLVGLSCGANGLVVIDLDLYKPGVSDRVANLEAELGFKFNDFPYCVRSLRGGLHVYMKMPEAKIKTGATVFGEGIDVIGLGITAADGLDYSLVGSVHGYDLDRLRLLPKMPDTLLQRLVVDSRSPYQSIPRVAMDRTLSSQREYDIVRELRHIDPDPYDNWITVGLALYQNFADPDDGFDVWLDWASQSIKFDDAEHADKWRSFSTNTTFHSVALIRKLAKRGILHV